MNKKLILLIFSLSVIVSCEYYKHTNPYDPDYEGSIQNQSSSADLKISSINIYDDCPGISLCYYGIKITIENKGKGFIELPFRGILSTNDSKIFLTGSTVTFPYSALRDKTFFRPGDKVDSFFSIEKKNNLILPYTVNLILTMKDNNNTWTDSVKAVITF